jgi:hypothetical protein
MVYYQIRKLISHFQNLAEAGNDIIRRNVKLKKIQLWKIVILLALSATPSVYASELSITPLAVANAVRIDISFTNSTGVTQMGFRSATDGICTNGINASYVGGPDFALGGSSPRVAYFNGHLPAIANALELCVGTTSGTIALDGVVTNRGLCSNVTGCYSYTCDQVGGIITGITPIDPFTATCD